MNNQRKGSTSNTHVGRQFEELAKQVLEQELGYPLDFVIELEVGARKGVKHIHKFDLGNVGKKVVVECKSHTWTQSGNVPSAKISNWDKEMYYFYMMNEDDKLKSFKKIFFCQRSTHPRRTQSLAEYYFDKRGHMIPNGVEIWEFDINSKKINKIKVQ